MRALPRPESSRGVAGLSNALTPVRGVFAALLLGALLLGAQVLPAPAGVDGGEEEAFILKPERGRTAMAVVQALAEGLRLERSLPGGMLLVQAPRGTLAASLRALPGVSWAEPDIEFSATARPNDPDYPKQWNLERIGMPAAWDLAGDGRESVVVAVLDSGVAYRDTEYRPRAPDLSATRFAPGYDFMAGDEYPDDEYGHGTHVAAIIASCCNNSFRAAGMA